MGVLGLISYIGANKIYDKVDLVDAAKNGRIEIIVNTFAFINSINELIIKKYQKEYKNDFLFVSLAENDIIEDVYYDLHISFRKIGIDLIWLIGGMQDCEDKYSESELEGLQQSAEGNIRKKEILFDRLTERQSVQDIRNASNFPWFEAFMKQLRMANAEIIYLIHGETTDSIVDIYRRRGSFAILTKNIDFVMFQGCKVLLTYFFSTYYGGDQLNLPFVDNETPSLIIKDFNEFFCPIVSCEHVMNHLTITHDQLIVTSMLKGNDYTMEHCRMMTYLIGITKSDTQDPYIMWVVNYVKRNNLSTRNLGDIPELRNYMIEHPDLQESLNTCNALYSMKLVLPDPIDKDADDLTIFLREKLYTGSLSRIVYYWLYGKFIDYVLPEQLMENGVYINNILGDIRSQLYPYLLKRSLDCVQEWRCRDLRVTEVSVTHSERKINEINGIPEGLNIFEQIWSHREPATLNYVERFGLEKAFILYLLRYLYKITKDENICLTEEEFKAVFVTVFNRYSEETEMVLNAKVTRDTFKRTRICPSPRCMTIGTWFAQICYTAYFYCAGALNLTEHFSFKCPLMNGSELCAFYETMNGDRVRYEHLQPDIIAALENTKDEIMNIFHDEYELIINEED